MGFITPWNPTGTEVDWGQWLQPQRNPNASPMVTDSRYSLYPGGWGVTSPTTMAGKPQTASNPSYALDTTGSSSVEAMTDYQKEQARLAQARLDFEKYQFNNPQPEVTSAYQQQQLANQQQSSQQTLAYQQAQLAAEQQWRQQQLDADKQQRLATLATQPKSWLEYASLANQAPVVQPWMLPLMPQDYQKTQPVGSAISGWTPENMKGMPDLVNPSAQYLARMGPTAQEQYYAYQQADQGLTPEEQQFRLWSQGPPSGSNKGLTAQR